MMQPPASRTIKLPTYVLTDEAALIDINTPSALRIVERALRAHFILLRVSRDLRLEKETPKGREPAPKGPLLGDGSASRMAGTQQALLERPGPTNRLNLKHKNEH
jgi:hypothetical protein